MKIGLAIGFFLFWPGLSMLQAQQFDLLIKGGYLIDEKNGIAEIMDLAILDGKWIGVENPEKRIWKTWTLRWPIRPFKNTLKEI